MQEYMKIRGWSTDFFPIYADDRKREKESAAAEFSLFCMAWEEMENKFLSENDLLHMGICYHEHGGHKYGIVFFAEKTDMGQLFCKHAARYLQKKGTDSTLMRHLRHIFIVAESDRATFQCEGSTVTSVPLSLICDPPQRSDYVNQASLVLRTNGNFGTTEVKALCDKEHVESPLNFPYIFSTDPYAKFARWCVGDIVQLRGLLPDEYDLFLVRHPQSSAHQQQQQQQRHQQDPEEEDGDDDDDDRENDADGEEMEEEDEERIMDVDGTDEGVDEGADDDEEEDEEDEEDEE